jgi:hypothetical protein
MRGQSPRIHVFLGKTPQSKTWMAGPSPATTKRDGKKGEREHEGKKWKEKPHAE